ncbi:MAG TPA: hypothetical protein VMB66_02160 [Candidatus Acidoferrales bacterium]|nr:hypothetical protein [Candidatus Acidoferrales bacterium]
MTEHLLKVEDAPALPQIIDRERVPHSVDGSGRRLKSESAAQKFDIAENVPAPLLRSFVCPKDESSFRAALSLEGVKPASQFERHRDEPVLPALAV